MRYKARKGLLWKEDGSWHKFDFVDTEHCACVWQEAYKQNHEWMEETTVLKCTKLCFLHQEKRQGASKPMKELRFPNQFEACLLDDSGKLLDLALSSKIESVREILEELYGETIDSACTIDQKIIFYTKAFDPDMKLLKRIVATSRKKKSCKLNQIARKQGRVIWQYEKLKSLSKHAEKDQVIKEKMKRQRKKLSKQKNIFLKSHKCARFYGQHCACGKQVHLTPNFDMEVCSSQPLTSVKKKARKEVKVTEKKVAEVIEEADDWADVVVTEERPTERVLLEGNFEWEEDFDAGF